MIVLAPGDFEEDGDELYVNEIQESDIREIQSEGLQIAVRAFKLFFDGMPISAIARELGISEALLLCYLPFRNGL